MANLKNLTTTTITTDSINDLSGTKKFDLSTIVLDGYYTRRILSQYDSTAYSTSATRRDFALGSVFPNITGFKAGSLIQLSFHVPTRNDSELWGGIFIEPQVRFNSGAWFSLGGTGYDVMLQDGRAISSYCNTILFDSGQTTDFDIQFQFYFAGHDTETEINGSHSINGRSGTADLDTNAANANQHYMSITVEELAKFSGS